MSDSRRIVRGSMSERQFQDAVLEMARLFGFRTYHTFNSRRSEAGFPDLVLVRDGRLIAAELKTETGRLSPAQVAWISDLERCRGVDVHVWRPGNLAEIERTLRSGDGVSTRAYGDLKPQVESAAPNSQSSGRRRPKGPPALW